MTRVLDSQLQHESFQWIFRVDFLQDWLVWSCCPRQCTRHPQTKACSTLVILHSHAQSCKKFQSLHVQIPADVRSFDETARFCCFNSYPVNKCSFWSLFSTVAACSFALFIGDFTVYSDPHVSSWGAIWWARRHGCALQREWLDDTLGSQCCRPWEQHYWITINIQVF